MRENVELYEMIENDQVNKELLQELIKGQDLGPFLAAAVKKGSAQMVKFFVEEGADVNTMIDTVTPIHKAVENYLEVRQGENKELKEKYREIIKFLLDKDADLNLADSDTGL